jgi:CubicO group peptidase (beta-lactamase class C family)
MSRLLSSICIVFLIACTQQKSETADPSNARTTSVQKYSIPTFPDSAAFDRMKQFLPVVDKVFKDYAEKNHFPSIAYGVVVGDQLIYSGATGSTNIKNNTPASVKSLYRIASMSKSFTGMAVLKLRDEGKLNLTDPVSKYVPEFAGSGKLTIDASKTTIMNLLTMSAGFPEDNPWGDRQLADSDQDLLDHVKGGVSYSNVPGVAYEYSNMGFALLGKIIGNVSGVPYQKYITDNIMKPIGMNDSRWEYSEVPEETLALGYRFEDGTWKEEPLLHDGSYGAMGGMICSIEDFAKYVSLHLSAWPPKNTADNGPISRGSIREMHQPWRVNAIFPQAKTRTGETCAAVSGYGYGLGWRQDCNGLIRIAHSGGLPGFGSEWRIYPEYNMGVISFSNHTYGAPGLPNAIVLDTLIQLSGLKKRELNASEILVQRRDEIVALLPDWKDGEQSKIFAENFWMDLDIAHRRSDTQALFKDAGPIKSVKPLKAQNQLRGTFVIECEKKNVEVFFTLTPEAGALVQQLDVRVVE